MRKICSATVWALNYNSFSIFTFTSTLPALKILLVREKTAIGNYCNSISWKPNRLIARRHRTSRDSVIGQRLMAWYWGNKKVILEPFFLKYGIIIDHYIKLWF